ncbi:MAG: ATP-dependent helicase HrpB [Acidobacteria bacterium]|nr:ATP-dependent helicase HrpB [Acidobacteriota bacterium]
METPSEPLPIDPHLPDIGAALTSAGALVLTAPPGAGKTTHIPPFLYREGFAAGGEILVLQPRRLAARMGALRVARELGEKPGETTGYAIRFETVGGPRTRIRFLTEAILVRRMTEDPRLEGVSLVILDEFHERSLATDLALAFLRRLRRLERRPRILVMSATMDPRPVAEFLDGAPVISLAETRYDLDIAYEETIDRRPLEERVAGAVLRLFRSGLEGDILVFLPGAAEIRRAEEALRPAAGRLGFRIQPLHGDLPAGEQTRALEPGEGPRVILSTNVAETSITIPGIGAVVDSGLARVSTHSAWSGRPTIATARIGKFSAAQRAGRAGRTRSGRVRRLYTRHDFSMRPDADPPEIRRADLSETLLVLHGSGVCDTGTFPWLEPPPPAALEAARTLLGRLGAVDPSGRITAAGRRMLRFPVHPRIARMMVEGEALGVADDAALLAALLGERDIRLDARARFGAPGASQRGVEAGVSDLLELTDLYREAEAARFAPERLRALGLDPRAVATVRLSHRQLARLSSRAPAPGSPAREPGTAAREPGTPGEREEALLVAVLRAFPDRVARRRRPHSHELLLASGGGARLSDRSVVRERPFLVAVDIEDRRDPSDPGATLPLVRLASSVEIEWLAALFPDALVEKTERVWNTTAGRVDEVRRTMYERIALEESVRPAPPSEEAARLLAAAAAERGIGLFPDHESVPGLEVRAALLARCFPDSGFPPLGADAVAAALARVCLDRRTLAELASVSFVAALLEPLSGRQRALLERETPERIRLARGRTVRVHYEPGRPPWTASRLQDFFGMTAAPTICGGRVALTVHLLAPNGRAVQVTQDLAGFWKNHYPAIRRELGRRYPKHPWPERPA